MTGHKALVIEDDAGTTATIAEILNSFGHDYDSAKTAEEARVLLRSDHYTYVLLDAQIPASASGGMPCPQNSINLLDEIRLQLPERRLPVIVMAGSTVLRASLIARLMRTGADDCVDKPFSSSGRTLTQAIMDILKKMREPKVPPTDFAAVPPKSGGFQGGEMVFRDDCVELCGVKILGNTGMGYSRRMLELLSRRGPDGRFINMTAKQLAEQINRYIGDSSIIGCVSTIRSNAKHRLMQHLGVEVQPGDVLTNDEQGYHLNEWITVKREDMRPDDPAMAPDDPGMTLQDDPAVTPVDPCLPALNQRQQWAVSQLEGGVHLTRNMLQTEFGVSPKTAKRDLASLRNQGLIYYIRSPWPGHYVSGDK